MTEEKKAKELIDKFKAHAEHDPYFSNIEVHNSIEATIKYNAKKCALIAVDEIIKTCNEIVQSNDCAPYYEESYWQKVKQSINKL